MKKHIKRKNSFKVMFSKVAVETLCLSCLIACLIVCGFIMFFYKGEFTTEFVVVACLVVCSLAALIGSHLLLIKAKMFITPIEKVNEAVKKVALGDFDVRIEKETGKERIDEFIMLEQNFNKMAKELQSTNFMQKDFISNVSHEIKTPIATIKGFTEILQGDGLSEAEKKEYLNLIWEEAESMTRLCDNMLKMSRVDKQQIVRKSDEVDISEQIRKTIIFLSNKWEEKNQEFDINLDKFVIFTDKDLLSEVWTNIIDNAIKYSGENTVISIAGKQSNGKVIIKITDQGIGIDKSKIEHIFDKFYQCEESHKKQGNGLGLSIVKRIIELLDGEIYCESELGVGTSFYICLKIVGNL